MLPYSPIMLFVSIFLTHLTGEAPFFLDIFPFAKKNQIDNGL